MNVPEHVNFQGEKQRFDNFSYHDEGSLSHETYSHNDHRDNIRYRDRDLNARVENLEHNRIVLLKKLDELKDQLSHSRIIDDKQEERMVYSAPCDPWFHDVKKKPFAANNFESPYVSHMHGYLPSPRNHVLGVRDSYSPRESPREFRGYKPHQRQLNHEGFNGYSKNINHDHVTLHPRENAFQAHSCSCVHCSNRNLDVSPKVDHFLQRRDNPDIHHYLNPILHVPQNYSSGGSSLHSQVSPTLNSNDLNYENDGFNNQHHSKANIARQRIRLCHPISGGAPFIICCNCFELLRLPRKHVSVGRKQQIKCGSCFSVILVEFGSKGNVISVSAHGDPISTYGSNNADMIIYINREDSRATDDKSKCNESEKQLNPPLSAASKQSEPTLSQTTTLQNSSNEVTTETEANMSISKFSNSFGSQASVETQKEDNPSIGSKPLKKIAQDLSKYNQSFKIEESKVLVNGHFIPFTDVMKAEKLAGPIQPGQYWYDHRSGFWGVMGHPCLGIIMPNIEEFNYPLSENCAAGDTGVFVNDRELHRKDLDILSSRGLPALKYGSYTVEFSGKVVDEHTGEELVNLGKLAPTVEKEKCGFGMRVP